MQNVLCTQRAAFPHHAEAAPVPQTHEDHLREQFRVASRRWGIIKIEGFAQAKKSGSKAAVPTSSGLTLSPFGPLLDSSRAG